MNAIELREMFALRLDTLLAAIFVGIVQGKIFADWNGLRWTFILGKGDWSAPPLSFKCRLSPEAAEILLMLTGLDWLR